MPVPVSVKPALYRSVVFWLGVFVLMFLGWAWVSSLRVGRSVTRDVVLQGPAVRRTGMPERAYFNDGVCLNEGKVTVLYTRLGELKPHVRVYYGPRIQMAFPAGPRWALRRGDDENDRATGMRLGEARRHEVHVPMWGITGGYVMLAAGVMGWRWRRWRRLAGEGEGDEAGPGR